MFLIIFQQHYHFFTAKLPQRLNTSILTDTMPKCRRGKIVENNVAKRYMRVRFDVFVRKIVKGVGEFDILAKKGRKLLAVEVKHSNRGRLITSGDVKRLIEKARRIEAKPILTLSGRSKLSYPGKKLARRCGVKIERL